mmetsp:Transcript_42339/g.76827  ORF Transcript_42339/g.76827 Transcript_42339/m.76827 type:complete len:169 (+) Transcript_42339:140-646(+)
MSLASLFAIALFSLGAGTRLGENEHLEPSGALPAASLADSGGTQESEEEFGKRCCCYFPMDKKYKSDPMPEFSKDTCPVRGCVWPLKPNGKKEKLAPDNPLEVCSHKWISEHDVYCNVTSFMGCNSRSGIADKIGPKLGVPYKWRECYGYKSDGKSLKECMFDILRDY